MPNDLESTIRNEQTILRNELQELKKCQIQYFLISLGVTGAVFGFNKELLGKDNTDMIYLAPLLVILPCWLTFFDKANTITRLTGYMRVFIEDELRNDINIYVGYENALESFRKREEYLRKKFRFSFKRMFKGIGQIIIAFFRNITRHQYWKINWLTFFLLSVTCGLYPYFKNRSFKFLDDPFILIVYLIFTCAIILSMIYTLWVLWELIFGKYSYQRVRNFWKEDVFDKLPKPTISKKP